MDLQEDQFTCRTDRAIQYKQVLIPQLYLLLSAGERLHSTTPHSNQPSPQPSSGRSSVDNQLQGQIQPTASVNNQSEQPLQASGSDTNNPDESEDEGLGLNGFSDSDSVRDMFKDISGIQNIPTK